MATQFTASVKKGGTVGTDCDYTTLSAAEAGLQNDLTATTTSLVFSISAATTPTIAAGDAVTGVTSLATGTCVLVNYTKTQVWINVLTGTFQNSEVVKKTTDAAVTVTLSDAGASVICGIRCRAGTADTTAVTTNGWTTSSTNYIRIYADEAGAVATMPYNTSGYRLEITGGSTPLTINEEYVRIERISIKVTSPAFASGNHAVAFSVVSATGEQRITGCYILGVMHASNTTAINGIYAQNNETLRVSNTIIDGFTNTGNTANAAYGRIGGSTIRFNNCMVINCATGFKNLSSITYIKNCLYDGGTSGNQVGFSGTPNTASNYNATNDTTAYGANSRVSQMFTYVSGSDYHLATNDQGAVDFGTDLSADTLVVTDDFDAVARNGTWDIGPYNVTAVAGQPTSKRTGGVPYGRGDSGPVARVSRW